jgi:glycosyltransferase involved in cell wall biosynthesis
VRRLALGAMLTFVFVVVVGFFAPILEGPPAPYCFWGLAGALLGGPRCARSGRECGRERPDRLEHVLRTRARPNGASSGARPGRGAAGQGVACTVVASGESRKARATPCPSISACSPARCGPPPASASRWSTALSLPTGPIAWLASRLRGSALILTVHGSDLYRHPRWARPLVAAVLRSADHVVAVGEQLAADLSARFGLPAERISVIDMGVDSAAFRALPQAEARRRLGLDPGPLLLAAGRLVPSKGLAVLLQSLADYPAAYREARLVVLGAGPEAAGLAAQAARLGLAERVRFAGAVARAELPLWLAAADCLVHPALEEGFGLAVMKR